MLRISCFEAALPLRGITAEKLRRMLRNYCGITAELLLSVLAYVEQISKNRKCCGLAVQTMWHPAAIAQYGFKLIDSTFQMPCVVAALRNVTKHEIMQHGMMRIKEDSAGR